MKFDKGILDKLWRLTLRSMPFVPGPELFDLVAQITRSQKDIDAQVTEAIESIQKTSALVSQLEANLKERSERLCNIFSVKVSRRVHWAGWIKGSYSSRFFRSTIPRRTRRAAPKRGAGKKADWGRSKPRGFCV